MIGRQCITPWLAAAALVAGTVAHLGAQAATITGTIVGRYGDSNVPGTPPRLEWMLRDDQSREWRVELPGALVEQEGGFRALQGRRVTVSGAASNGARPLLRATSLRGGGGMAALSAAPPQLGSKPYALLLCKFSDVAAEPMSPAEATTLLSNSYPNMDHYYREISAGQMDLVGSQAFGWFTLTQPRSFYVTSGSVNLTSLAQHCATAAEATVDFTQFFGVIIQVNADLDGFAWGGSTFITVDGQSRVWPSTWMPLWATGVSKHGVYAHEIGHSLGLPHSSGPYSATYDSDWDVMSNAYLTWNAATTSYVGGHTIIYHKDLVGWIPPSRKVTVGPGSVSLTLAQSESPPGGTDPLMVVIPIPGSNHYYTLEGRRRTGYDTDLPGEGVVVHRVQTGTFTRATVVDVDNNGDPNDAAAYWVPGETFSDANGVVVQVAGFGSGGWNLVIGLPGVSRQLTVAGAGSGNGTVTSTPSGINCTSAAGTTAGTCSAGFADGSSVTLVATPTSGTFTGWSGACTGTGNCVVSMTQARNVTATFMLTPSHVLTVAGVGTGNGTVTSVPAGIACTSTEGTTTGTCSVSFAEGSSVTLTAGATSGTFGGWSGACTGTGQCVVSMGSAQAVTAAFNAPAAHPLTILGAGTGTGAVTSAPGSIVCNIVVGVRSGNCEAFFSEGTVVTLTAATVAGAFTAWEGACSGTAPCQVTVDQARTVTARFELPRHLLTVTPTGSGNGTITSVPAGIDCASSAGTLTGTCSGDFLEGIPVALSAVAANGSFMMGWGGACANATDACQFVVAGPRSATVAFASNQEVIGLAADALMGSGTLPAALRSALDATGNQNGAFDAGDLVALIDRTPGATLTARVVRAIAGGRP